MLLLGGQFCRFRPEKTAIAHIQEFFFVNSSLLSIERNVFQGLFLQISINLSIRINKSIKSDKKGGGPEKGSKSALFVPGGPGGGFLGVSPKLGFYTFFQKRGGILMLSTAFRRGTTIE